MLAFLQADLAVTLPLWVLPSLHKMAISHAELLEFFQGCDSMPLRLKSRSLRWIRPWLTGHARG
jgi:hypothetical protein